MKNSTVSISSGKCARRGVTIIEAILAMVILSVLAILAVNALFYPRYLVVNSGLEQSAIHAGIAEIERNLYALNSFPLGEFNTDGWDLLNITGDPLAVNETIPGTSGDSCNYLIISNTITYRSDKTVELITYRSLEISSSSR